MRRLITLIAALLLAGSAAATQVIYGYTIGAPYAGVYARDTESNTWLTTSDTNCFYSLIVSNGFSGDVYPADNSYLLNPSSYSVSSLASNLRLDFTSTPASVSGIVYSTNGVPVAGTPIDISGNSTSLVWLTGIDGSYFVRLPANWSGTVTPSPILGLQFSPTQSTITGLTSNYVQNFSLGGVYVSGTVTKNSGYGVNGVMIVFTGATHSVNVVTTNGGLFSTTLPYGWVGVCYPTNAYGTFAPDSISFLDGIRDIDTSVNFVQLILAPKVSGRVTRYMSPQTGVRGVPIVFSDGTTVFTDDYGFYVHEVLPGWTGTETPTRPPLVFHPISRSYTNVVRNQSLRNFEWIPPGTSWTDPMAFLTNQLTPGPQSISVVQASQVSTRPAGNLQTNLVTVDSNVWAAASSAILQQNIADLVQDPSWMWASTNIPSLWGGFIASKNWWATNELVYPVATVNSLRVEEGVTADTATFYSKHAVASAYESAASNFVASGIANYYALTNSYLTTTSGVYDVSLSVFSEGLADMYGVYPALCCGVGANVYKVAASPDDGRVLKSVRATMYLGPGTWIHPYLYSSVSPTSSVSPILMIQFRPIRQASDSIWE